MTIPIFWMIVRRGFLVVSLKRSYDMAGMTDFIQAKKLAQIPLETHDLMIDCNAELVLVFGRPT